MKKLLLLSSLLLINTLALASTAALPSNNPCRALANTTWVGHFTGNKSSYNVKEVIGNVTGVGENYKLQVTTYINGQAVTQQYANSCTKKWGSVKGYTGDVLLSAYVTQQGKTYLLDVTGTTTGARIMPSSTLLIRNMSGTGGINSEFYGNLINVTQ